MTPLSALGVSYDPPRMNDPTLLFKNAERQGVSRSTWYKSHRVVNIVTSYAQKHSGRARALHMALHGWKAGVWVAASDLKACVLSWPDFKMVRGGSLRRAVHRALDEMVKAGILEQQLSPKCRLVRIVSPPIANE